MPLFDQYQPSQAEATVPHPSKISESISPKLYASWINLKLNNKRINCTNFYRCFYYRTISNSKGIPLPKRLHYHGFSFSFRRDRDDAIKPPTYCVTRHQLSTWPLVTKIYSLQRYMSRRSSLWLAKIYVWPEWQKNKGHYTCVSRQIPP